MNDKLKSKLDMMPDSPGCYIYKDVDDKILYVGKAKKLKSRVRQYFDRVYFNKTANLVKQIHDVEFVMTRNEKEALVLEINLIKQYMPPFNVIFMDDKHYPYIALSKESYPRLTIRRDAKSSKYKHYGPYPDSKAAYKVLNLLNSIYPFRKCNQIPKKHCLYYDMGQCLAPCENNVTKEDYENYIMSVSKFLNGNDTVLLDLLKQKMEQASEALEFEKAIEYRNLITSITSLMEKQTMTLNDGVTRDIFGFYVSNETVCVQVLHMRSGRIIERSGEVFDIVDNLDDLLVSYIYTFYDSKDVLVPSEILTPYIEGINIISELLNVKTYVPVRGIKKKLVDLVCENAKNNLDNLDKLRLIKLSKTKGLQLNLKNPIH